MKIKTTNYHVERINKRDVRLKIGISIKLSENNTINSAGIIQLHPIAYFSDKVSPISFNLLYLSAIVYAIDRSVNRECYSVDGWSRDFDVEIGLPDHVLFKAHEDEINNMLSFLTGDYWSCKFIKSNSFRMPSYKTTTIFDGITQVNLFSGGMDSLIGAIDYMSENLNGKVFLASHYDSHIAGPNSDQMKLKRFLKSKYDKRFIDIPAVMISPDLSQESTCRSRSMMFISIATIIAQYANCDIAIPENGSVSLNYPLSPSRRSSCSTRTTHPIFIRQFQNLLINVGIKISLFNPYEKKTKGEMVTECSDKDFLLRIVANSNSCGKRGRHQNMHDNKTATHCGHCMPCMYRRAALIGKKDDTTYGNKFITLYNRKGTKLSEDFFAMLEFLKKDLKPKEIRRELIVAGMGGFPDLDDYVNLVIRTREEVSAMIRDDNNSTILRYMNWL